MKFPNKCIVDTNIPIIANQIEHPDFDLDSDINDEIILECINAIEFVRSNNALVLDNDDEIFNQYRSYFSKHLQSRYGNYGAGDYFYLWVRDNRFNFSEEDRVSVTKINDTYVEYPSNEELNNFDISDKVFIAVANKHKDKPSVLQGTDSKWWGFKEILKAIDINIFFLCPEYVEKKYIKKMM